MKFSEKILYLKKKVPSYPNQSIKWLFSKIQNTDKKFSKVVPSDLKIGGFYFMYYDMKAINKSTKIEQLVPFLLVDYKPDIDKKVIWIMNFNFISLSIKEAFFSQFIDKNYQKTFDLNSEIKSVNSENPLPNINYLNMWNQLIKYGINYSLREVRVDLIQDLYRISTDNLHYLITLNTQTLTGVDEKKLNEIWITKLKTDTLEDRVDELKLKSSYDEIIKELKEAFKYLDEAFKKL